MNYITFFIGITIIFLSCTTKDINNYSDNLSNNIVLRSANLEQEDIGMVNGTLFFVQDFNVWLKAYSKVSKGLIISLRNVDNPSVNLVFEGLITTEVAQERVSLLTSETFLKDCSAMGDPMTSFYRVEYYDKTPNPTKYYFALSFTDKESHDWLTYVAENRSLFSDFGIEVAGIGTDPEQTNDVYILFRQNDFVAFRKMLNSPRKIKRFLEQISVPEDALISYWVRTNQPAS